jgi:predicted O-methyltransferase YrrM
LATVVASITPHDGEAAGAGCRTREHRQWNKRRQTTLPLTECWIVWIHLCYKNNREGGSRRTTSRTLGIMFIADIKSRLRRFIESCVQEAWSEDKLRRCVREALPDDLLTTLPGTPYSRYAVPVDYVPSRQYEPRWGNTKPVIPILEQWFTEHISTYRDILDDMTANRDALASIAVDFDTRNLPQPGWFGIALCAFDGAALYTMVKRSKPKRYLEIGSGVSTCFAYKAIRDAKLDTKIVSIDPEPRSEIDSICDEVVRDGLETCDTSLFDQLEAGDILFFDGSHRSFMNSDVTVFMIDILPNLKPGVLIHVHDINLPWDYHILYKNWYWNEQYLLAVYMMNARERIVPVLPTAFVCKRPEFADWFRVPLIDFGAERNTSWTGGGSMWFTHK